MSLNIRCSIWNAKCDKNNANNNIIKGKNKNRFLRSKIDFPKSSIEVRFL